MDQDSHREEYVKTDGQCCFNHIIGLPVKNGKEHPIFDYEKLVYDTIENNSNIWIQLIWNQGGTAHKGTRSLE